MEVTSQIEQNDYETERGKPMPSLIHSRIQTRIATYLAVHYYAHYEAFTELTLDLSGEKSIPDVCICPLEQIDFMHDEIKRTEPPLATIEILSPTQVLQTLIDKTSEYFSFGVKSCWVVIPPLQSVYVFSNPYQHEVFSLGEEIIDANLNVRIPMDFIFSKNMGTKT